MALAGQRVHLELRDAAGERFSLHESLLIPGEVVLSGLSAGQLRILATTKGAAPALQRARVASGEERQVNISFARGVQVRGVVRSEEGLPLGGATVTLLDPGFDRKILSHARSGPDGAYALPGVPARACHLACGHDTAKTWASRLLSAEELVTDVVWDPVLPVWRSFVSGVVVDAGEAPVAGAIVLLHEVDNAQAPISQGVASSDGSFLLVAKGWDPESDSRRFALSVLTPGLPSLIAATVSTIPIPARELRIVLRQGGARLTGRILGSDGRVDARISVGIRQTARPASVHQIDVGLDGAFDSGPIPPGTYELVWWRERGPMTTLLRVQDLRGPAKLGTLTLTHDSLSKLEILTDRRSERLLANVFDTEGRVVDSAWIDKRTGSCSFEVPVGTYVVHCLSERYATMEKRVVVGNALTRVLFDGWKPGAPIQRSTLRRIEGEGVASIRIFANSDPVPLLTWKGELDRFRESGAGFRLSPGRYVLVVAQGGARSRYELLMKGD